MAVLALFCLIYFAYLARDRTISKTDICLSRKPEANNQREQTRALRKLLRQLEQDILLL